MLLGEARDGNAISRTYFDTVYKMMPFIHRRKFERRLENLWSDPRADFVLVLLCMHLVIQHPRDSADSMHSTLYARIKGFVALLESAGRISIDVVQARLLLALFELGHAFHTAASISVSACAVIGRAIGLDHKLRVSQDSDTVDQLIEEEEGRRVWWSIAIMDKYVVQSQVDPFSRSSTGTT